MRILLKSEIEIDDMLSAEAIDSIEKLPDKCPPDADKHCIVMEIVLWLHEK